MHRSSLQKDQQWLPYDQVRFQLNSNQQKDTPKELFIQSFLLQHLAGFG